MTTIRLYKPISVIRGKFIITQAENLLLRVTSASSLLNHQYNPFQNKREYSINVKQNIDDSNSNDSHCTLEEWNNAKPFKDIPGPKPLPIVGNTWRFLPFIGEYDDVKENLSGFIKKVNKQYGDIVSFQKIFGLENGLYLYDPSDIEKAYKFESIMPKRDLLPSMTYFRNNMRQDLFKNTGGLVTSQGIDWHTFRNKVNPIMMQPKMIKQYVHPINTIAKELMHRIKSVRGTDNQISVDFWKEINKWSLESIAFLALDMRLGCLDEKFSEDSVQARMIDLAEKVFVYSGKLDYDVNMWKYFSTPMFKKAMTVYNDQIILIEELIKQATKKINDKKSEKCYDKESAEPSVLEKLLDIDENVAFIMALDMIIAGVDTTSTTLTNILYYLATNQSKQEILKNEINKLLPDKNFELNSDHLNSMPYLKACIKEAYRMYPIGAGIIRYLTKDAVLSGYKIPKGTLLIFNHMCISMSEKYYAQPNEYIPERWLRENLNSDISYKNAHPFCTMPFGFGSRSCIGRRFAELELEIAVINFMKNFNLSWEGPPPIRATTSINCLLGPFKFIFEEAK